MSYPTHLPACQNPLNTGNIPSYKGKYDGRGDGRGDMPTEDTPNRKLLKRTRVSVLSSRMGGLSFLS